MIPELQQRFILEANTPSDINQHLPLMNILAKLCTHVTEFGVRWGNSATVWFNNPVVVRGYDIREFEEATAIFTLARSLGRDCELIIADTGSLQSIEQTDLLFIDSLHTYEHVKKELEPIEQIKYLVDAVPLEGPYAHYSGSFEERMVWVINTLEKAERHRRQRMDSHFNSKAV